MTPVRLTSSAVDLSSHLTQSMPTSQSLQATGIIPLAPAISPVVVPIGTVDGAISNSQNPSSSPSWCSSMTRRQVWFPGTAHGVPSDRKLYPSLNQTPLSAPGSTSHFQSGPGLQYSSRAVPLSPAGQVRQPLPGQDMISMGPGQCSLHSQQRAR